MATGFTIRGLPGCPPLVVTAVRVAAGRLHKPPAISGRIRVTISPALTVANPDDGDPVFGCYLPQSPFRAPFEPQILIAAGSFGEKLRLGQTEEEALADVIDTFLHEFAHHEQAAAGRPLTERGIQVRVRSLLQQIGRILP